MSTDNYVAGKELGKYTKKLINEDSGDWDRCACAGNLYGYRKGTGIRDGLGEYEEQISEVVFCNSSYEKAYELTKDMIRRHPKLDILIGNK